MNPRLVSSLARARRKPPRAAQIMGDHSMGGVVDATVEPGGLYSGYPNAPIQPLPAPRRKRRTR